MKVGIIMGSTSDYEVMSGAEEMLKALDIPFEKRVVSAHRTPDLMYEYAKTAKARGISVIIAGAGGAAHLPGMVAAMTRNISSSQITLIRSFSLMQAIMKSVSISWKVLTLWRNWQLLSPSMVKCTSSMVGQIILL